MQGWPCLFNNSRYAAFSTAEERGRKQARDDDVEEGWHRFVADQSGELS